MDGVTIDIDFQHVKQYKAMWRLVRGAKELIRENKEQQKIIELMSEFINNIDVDEDICKVMGEKPYCDKYYNANNCIKCVIDYFKKKARDENENTR